MAIHTLDQWWYGTESEDIRAYLEALSKRSYAVHQFRLARCGCGSVEFAVEVDDPAGVARRTCKGCGRQHFICDSGEFWDEADPKVWKCNCGSTTANVGVGFSLYDDGEIKWLFVGLRCVQCGMLGSVAGWKIGYSPSLHLMDRV
jgi:hypothetical protein